jgi:hypothetical protein
LKSQLERAGPGDCLSGQEQPSAGDGQVDAAAPPDVDEAPFPAGPAPIPYVNIAKSSDLAGGTKSMRKAKAFSTARDVDFAAGGAASCSPRDDASKDLAFFIERLIDRQPEGDTEAIPRVLPERAVLVSRPRGEKRPEPDPSPPPEPGPSPGELPEGARLRAAQIERLSPLHADGPAERETTLEHLLESALSTALLARAGFR